MHSVSLADAKASLSDLVNRAIEGEVVTITRRGKPVARLVPARTARRKIALATLQAVSAATPRQHQDSAALLRRMREDARY
jgi:prevent-host-death family protein